MQIKQCIINRTVVVAGFCLFACLLACLLVCLFVFVFCGFFFFFFFWGGGGRD